MVEYVMSKSMYVALVREISKGKKLGNPKAEVMKCINQTYGIKGTVTELRIEG